MRNTRWWLWGGVLLIIALLYGQTANFGFVWDDEQIIYGRPDYRDPAQWLQAARKPLDFSPNYFRPLALSSLLVQIWLWGDTPAPFHLANALIHLVNTLLVMAIAWRLLRNETLSAASGLLYGLHPALVESVAFVSSRYDLLMTTFLLLAFWLSLVLNGWKRVVGTGAALLCAMLCKEMAVMALLAFPVAYWAIHKASANAPRPDRTLYIGFGVILALYLVLRWLALGYLLTAPAEGAQVEAGTPLQHLLLVGRTFATLMGLVIFPFFSVSPVHHSPLPIPLNDWLAWVQLAFSVGVIVVMGLAVRRAPVLGGMFWAGVILLLPVLNLRPLEFAFGVFTAERFLTAPLAFFVLGVSAWGAGLLQRGVSRLWWAGVGLWATGALIASALVLPNWRESGVFWEWVTRAAPNSPVGYSNLSDYYNKRGDFQRGLEYAERAIQIAPESGMGWVNKGVALLRLGNPQGAIEMFRKATQVDPQNVIGWNNLAIMLAEQGQLDEAEQIVKKHVLGKVPLMLGYQAMAYIQLLKARPDLAEPYVQQALRHAFHVEGSLAAELADRLRSAETWLASAYRAMLNGDLPLAQRLLEEGKRRDPDKLSLAFVEGMLLLRQGHIREAEVRAQALLQEGYNDPRLYELLAACAEQQGDTATARALREKAKR